ncbi:MAG: hypothetical protein M9909_05535 [Thermomicrobiales bacterium]|nr:hypothetical protein [Thermomicrobiales bacterium]
MPTQLVDRASQDVDDIQEVEDEQRKRLKQAAMLTATAGLLFSTLAMICFLIIPGRDQRQLDTYAGGDSVTRFLALYVFPIAGISFIWFIVPLRMWISQRMPGRVNALLSNIQLVSGIVFLVLFFTSAAALSIGNVVLADDSGTTYNVTSFGFPQYGHALFFVFASRMGAMFVFSTTSIVRQTDIFPVWFIWLGYSVGLFMLLSASFNQALFFVFPVWILLLCLLVINHLRQIIQGVKPMVITGARIVENEDGQ